MWCTAVRFISTFLWDEEFRRKADSGERANSLISTSLSSSRNGHSYPSHGATRAGTKSSPEGWHQFWPGLLLLGIHLPGHPDRGPALPGTGAGSAALPDRGGPDAGLVRIHQKEDHHLARGLLAIAVGRCAVA